MVNGGGGLPSSPRLGAWVEAWSLPPRASSAHAAVERGARRAVAWGGGGGASAASGRPPRQRAPPPFVAPPRCRPPRAPSPLLPPPSEQGVTQYSRCTAGPGGSRGGAGGGGARLFGATGRRGGMRPPVLQGAPIAAPPSLLSPSHLTLGLRTAGATAGAGRGLGGGGGGRVVLSAPPAIGHAPPPLFSPWLSPRGGRRAGRQGDGEAQRHGGEGREGGGEMSE